MYCKAIGLSVISIIFFTAPAFAQRELGVATSDWGAMNSMWLNPSSIASSNEKVVVSLFSLNVGVDNNLGTFTKISNIGKVSKGNDSGSATSGIFNNSGHAQFSMLIPALEIRGPGVLVAINKTMAIGISTRIRAVNQLNNFDQSLYTEVTTSDTPTGNYSITAQKFNWTADVWSELNLSFGMVVMDNDYGQLKVGATLRHMSGIAYLGLKANNLNLKYTSGNDSFYASKTDLEFASNVVSANSAVFSGVNSSTILSNFFGSSEGGGFGGDIGATYSRILDYGGKNASGDNSEHIHRISGSVSVVDIGAINYNNHNYIINVSGDGYLNGKAIGDYKGNVDSIRAYAIRQGFHADTSSKATKVHMPTALLIGADYQVYKHVYVNATYVANLADRQQFGNSVYNQFTVTPRYDSHIFTFGLPITYSTLAHDLKMGIGLRVGGFFLGSDDMLALVSDNQYGFNFYLGGYVPIRKRELKEKHIED